jgi:hypothetical protein
MPYPGPSDSAWMDSSFPNFLFPDAYLRFHPRSLYDPHDFFERNHDWMERFFEEFTSPDDSMYHFHPKWQHLPQRQKKPAQDVEI